MTKAFTTTLPAPPKPSVEFTREQVELIKRTVAKGATDDELQLFLGLCRRTGLDPFARQVYCIRRWDSREKREVAQFQVSIDGFRLIAARTREYEGAEGPFWCGGNGVWHDVWLGDEPPSACKMGVWRTGCRAPFWAVARFSGYVQLDREGRPAGLWRKMPAAMLAKACEALSLRRAFPQELSGLYTPDELAQDRDPDPSHTAPPAEAAPEAKAPGEQAAPARAVWIQEMIHQFGKLKARLGPEEHVYYSVLSEFGVQHCNQFKNYRQAAGAYRQLEARVRELEGAANLSEAEIEADLNDEMWQDPEATT